MSTINRPRVTARLIAALLAAKAQGHTDPVLAFAPATGEFVVAGESRFDHGTGQSGERTFRVDGQEVVMIVDAESIIERFAPVRKKDYAAIAREVRAAF